MPLNHILRKCAVGYKLTKLQEKITHLMYMDDVKLFAKNQKELETLIHAVRIYRQDIGMKFGIEKHTMLIMNSYKWHKMNGREQSTQEKIRMLSEKESYKYWRILEADTIKQVEMKEKMKKRVSQENKKLLETKLYQRDKYLPHKISPS